MSTEMSAIKVAGLMAAAVAVGTAYVLVHEHRRKGKKERKALEVATMSWHVGSTALGQVSF